MNHDSNPLTKALRAMPVPEPRPGFVDRALRNATQVTMSSAVSPEPATNRWGRVATRWETWFGAALGGAVAATLTLVLMRPTVPDRIEPVITLSLNEARDIDVLIDSDRDLTDATIRIAATGGIVLNGFDNEHIVDWRTDLERGPNLLSLPVIARKSGEGQLVAVIEHDGRTRTMMINLTVSGADARRT